LREAGDQRRRESFGEWTWRWVGNPSRLLWTRLVSQSQKEGGEAEGIAGSAPVHWRESRTIRKSGKTGNVRTSLQGAGFKILKDGRYLREVKQQNQEGLGKQHQETATYNN